MIRTSLTKHPELWGTRGDKKSKAMSLIYLFLYWHVVGIGIPDTGGSRGAEAYQIREVEEAINLPGCEKLLNFRQLG